MSREGRMVSVGSDMVCCVWIGPLQRALGVLPPHYNGPSLRVEQDT